MSRKTKQNPEWEQRVDELFRAIADLDEVDAMEYLKTVTAPPEVLDRVVELIQSDSENDNDDDAGQDAVSSRLRLGSQADFENILAPERAAPDLSGLTLEGLKFHRRLGSGGMGDVYLAEDTRLHRKVAVKVILDTFRFEQRAKDRFRREAQILSQLDHPGICRIFNLIEAETQDYLVLEYVDGATLRSWLETEPSFRRRLSVAEALVSAIAVAHEQGVVHRDLKPDNIMIVGKDQVKILDFGISRHLSDLHESDDSSASAMSHRPNSDMHKTMPGVMLGTLQFMSPEQANGEPAGTASDIYSLGILFQLMFSDAPVESPPPGKQPGTRQSAGTKGRPISGVTKDLLRLVERMKLAAPAARPTAVEATGTLRGIRQQPRRRLRMVLAATLAAMALLAGTKYTLDLRHEREQAQKARLESEQVSDFLINLFNVSNPEESAGEVITARELLDEGATRIDQELVDQPSVRARLKTTIGKVYLKLGLFEPARQQLQLSLAIIEANGLLHTPVHVQILSALGMLETETNDYAAAEAWYEKATAAFRQSPEAGQKSLLDIKDGLAMIYARTDRLDQALELNQEVLVATLAAAEPKFLDIANAYNNVGLQFWRKQQLQQAEDHMRLALDSLHQADRGDLALEATLLGNLALILSDQGELVESAQMAQTTVQIREQIYGESHPSLALAYDNLAVSQFRAGLLDDAEASNLKALDLYAETYGKKHADYAWTLANRAVILREKGDLDGSVLALLDVIDIMQTALGKNHTGVAENQSKLSTVYLLQGRPADALSSSEGAVATYKASQVEMSLYVSRSWFQLAHLQQQMGEFAAAKLTLQDLLSRLEQVADMDPAIAKQVTEALDELSALTGQ